MRGMFFLSFLLVFMGVLVASGYLLDVGGGNPTVSVSGYVFSSSSTPIVGAEVRRCSVCAPVSTDAQGHYSVNVVSDATYTFTVSATGFEPVTRDIIVPYGSNVRADFTLNPTGGGGGGGGGTTTYDCNADGVYESSTPCSAVTPSVPTGTGTQTFDGMSLLIGIVLILVGIGIAIFARG